VARKRGQIYEIHRNTPFEFAETSPASQTVIHVGRSVFVRDVTNGVEPGMEPSSKPPEAEGQENDEIFQPLSE